MFNFWRCFYYSNYHGHNWGVDLSGLATLNAKSVFSEHSPIFHKHYPRLPCHYVLHVRRMLSQKFESFKIPATIWETWHLPRNPWPTVNWSFPIQHFVANYLPCCPFLHQTVFMQHADWSPQSRQLVAKCLRSLLKKIVLNSKFIFESHITWHINAVRLRCCVSTYYVFKLAPVFPILICVSIWNFQ